MKRVGFLQVEQSGPGCGGRSDDCPVSLVSDDTIRPRVMQGS